MAGEPGRAVARGLAAVRRAALAAALLFAATACSQAEQDFGFAIAHIEAQQGRSGVELVITQELSLSSEATEALRHGVPLVIEVEARLRAPGRHTDAARLQRSFELRYLPLSGHYQLVEEAGAEVRTFPRLRHALADLAQVRLPIPSDSLAGGSFEARARCRLRMSELPPPMRLPARMSAAWRHDSGWSAESVELPARA